MKKNALLLGLILAGQGLAHSAARTATDSLGVVGHTEYSSLQSIFSYSKYGYLILAIFLIGVLFAALRGRDLFLRERVIAFNLFKGVRGYLKNNQLAEAANIAQAVETTALGRIYTRLLGCCREAQERNLPQDQLNEMLQIELRTWELDRLSLLSFNLGWIGTLAWACFLIGVMGVAFGLINAAAEFSQADLTAFSHGYIHRGIHPDNPLTMFVDFIGRFRYALGDLVLGCAAAVPLLLLHRLLLTQAEKIANEARLYAQKLLGLLNGSHR